MHKYSQNFEKFYEYVHTRTHEILEHWRVHTNRRTIFFLVIGGTFVISLYVYAIRPPNNFPVGQLVTIEKGQTDKEIALALYNSGVIRSPLLFRITAKVTGKARQLHAGDYLFKQPQDVFSITHAVAVGAYGLEPYRIRISEGAKTSDMVNVFSTVLPRFNIERFLEKAQPQEGFLFPDTYFFLPNATDDTVIQTMRDNFDTQIATIQSEIDASGRPLSDVVIMASIVEREARNYEDRRMIAGVLWRRIDKGIALQADATFRYINGKGTFDLTKADLANESPYNTYKHKGLPPTAIGSPSLASLEATVTPIDKGYLFYLADNNGVTHYAKTYAQHQANERLYLGK
ncbi:MAG: endolytic transglycosylase MltG [bacterium]|nr:endolytic transglycosylase MltG [bacterium]